MIPARLLMVTALLLVAACEPMGPVPGGMLSGTESQTPVDWGAIADVEVVQLETAGPYSVNLWAVTDGDRLYVVSSRGASGWLERLTRSPDVRLRVEDDIYLLRASRVDVQTERERVADLYQDKYELRAREDFPDAVLIRLVSR